MKGREAAHLKKVISSTVDEHGNELVGRCGAEIQFVAYRILII